MNYTVKIDNQTYTVEIGDLHIRPIIATINDERFEVWPEPENGRLTTSEQQNSLNPEVSHQTPASPQAELGVPLAQLSKTVRAPIPGMITEVLVQAGQSVTVGQPLCVLDAMKMSNTIYAARTGVIANVAISIGQHVKHSDIMIEFAD